MELPAPECRAGYTEAQLAEILGERYDEFCQWMRGQTVAICTGQVYNYETSQYEDDEPEGHGRVTYSHDLQRFLDKLPVVD